MNHDTIVEYFLDQKELGTALNDCVVLTKYLNDSKAVFDKNYNTYIDYYKLRDSDTESLYMLLSSAFVSYDEAAEYDEIYVTMSNAFGFDIVMENEGLKDTYLREDVEYFKEQYKKEAKYAALEVSKVLRKLVKGQLL